jgi:hypothetical protein
MEQEKDRSKPASNSDNKTLSKHYLGTGVAKAYKREKTPDTEAGETNDNKREIIPVEIKEFLSWTHQNHNAITAFATVGILTATVIYTGFAILQWIALRDSNDINRQSLQSVQRAYVTCNDIEEIINTAVVNGIKEHVWKFSAKCENSGTTPAISEIAYFNGDNLPNEPTGEQFIGPPKSHRPISVIGPKSPVEVGELHKMDSFILGNEPFSSIGLVEPQHVIFWAWVAYRDVFPGTKPHVTEVCQKLFGLASNRIFPNPSIGFSLLNCETHNCTDEYCADYDKIAALVPQ